MAVGRKTQLYNSIYLFSPEGEIILTYQKHFLYEADEFWAEEGPSFLSREVKGMEGKVEHFQPLFYIAGWHYGGLTRYEK